MVIVNVAAVFNLLVVIKFKDQNAVDKFILHFAPLSKFVKEHEPNTTMYQLSKSDKEDVAFTYHLIERYKNKEEDYLKTHKSSEAFQKFRAILQEMMDNDEVTVAGESFVDVDI